MRLLILTSLQSKRNSKSLLVIFSKTTTSLNDRAKKSFQKEQKKITKKRPKLIGFHICGIYFWAYYIVVAVRRFFNTQKFNIIYENGWERTKIQKRNLKDSLGQKLIIRK